MPIKNIYIKWLIVCSILLLVGFIIIFFNKSTGSDVHMLSVMGVFSFYLAALLKLYEDQ